MCICLYTIMLLNVVSHYDVSVLSMSVMGFQKNSLDNIRECVGRIQGFFGDFFNFAKPLTPFGYNTLSQPIGKGAVAGCMTLT